MPDERNQHSEREPVITLRSAAEHLSSRLTLNPNPVELENAADLLLHFATHVDKLEEQNERLRDLLRGFLHDADHRDIPHRGLRDKAREALDA